MSLQVKFAFLRHNMDLILEPKKDKKDKAERVKNTRSSLKPSSHNATGTGSAKPTGQTKNKDKQDGCHLDSPVRTSLGGS